MPMSSYISQSLSLSLSPSPSLYMFLKCSMLQIDTNRGSEFQDSTVQLGHPIMLNLTVLGIQQMEDGKLGIWL